MWKSLEGNIAVARTIDIHGQIAYKLFNQDEDDLKILFPNKIRDLKGKTLNVLMLHQYPRLWYQGNKIIGRDIFLPHEFFKHHNSKIDVSQFNQHTIKSHTEIDLFREFLKADLLLNTGFKVKDDPDKFRQIWSHEMVGYCALIPKSPPIPFFYYLLAPFDSITWMLTSLSVTIASILWNIIYSRRLTRS